MSREDLSANRAVRSVLVRHWLNLGLLTIRTTAGRTTLRGELKRIEGVKNPLSPSIVESLFAEIKRIPSVRHVHMDMVNWTQVGGRWQPREQDKRMSDEQAFLKDDSEKNASRAFDFDRHTNTEQG